MTDESIRPTLTRRACLRLTILAATALSLLPSCRRQATGTSPLDKWAELGRVWRAMRAVERKRNYGSSEPRRFARLKQEMTSALAALPASPELRLVFAEKAEAIDTYFAQAEALRHGKTCYIMVVSETRRAALDVEGQAQELDRLVADGKLTKEAATKAAAVMARAAELIARYKESKAGPQAEAKRTLEHLRNEYSAKTLKPGPPAQEAGERLAEMTVDRLGMIRPLPSPLLPGPTDYSMPATPSPAKPGGKP